MSEKMTKESFDPHVGETFQMDVTESQVIDVTLHSIRSLGKREKSDLPWLQNNRMEPFALLFLLPTAAELPQKIYTLTHAKLGEQGIFLVPVGIDENGRYYEAVFN